MGPASRVDDGSGWGIDRIPVLLPQDSPDSLPQPPLQIIGGVNEHFYLLCFDIMAMSE
jgi:hypothetical protein